MSYGVKSLQDQGIVKPLSEMDHNSPEYLHILIEALRLAFAGMLSVQALVPANQPDLVADSQWYVTDPDVQHVPVDELLSNVCLYFFLLLQRLISCLGISSQTSSPDRSDQDQPRCCACKYLCSPF